MGDITKAEILHLGWKISKAYGCRYKYTTNVNTYYMWITFDVITIRICKPKQQVKDSTIIFIGNLECIDELNTLMYQLGITKI
jgi:hypothetical protein